MHVIVARVLSLLVLSGCNTIFAAEVFHHVLTKNDKEETYITGSNVWGHFKCFKIDKALCLDKIKVLFGVLVLFIGFGFEVQIEVGTIILIIVILGELIRDLSVKADCSFVGPAPCHVFYCVSPAAKHKNW